MLARSAAVAGSAAAQTGLGFRFEPGYQTLGREWGEALEGAADADFALLFGFDRVRIGAGVNWTSMRIASAPGESWQHTTGRLILGYVQPAGSRTRLVGEVAYLRRTARPEGSRLFDDAPPTEHIGPFRAKGDGVETRVGVEVGLGPTTALTVSGTYQRFGTLPDPEDVGLPQVSSGSAWRVGLGVTWFPVAEDATAAAGTRAVDSPNRGLAVGVGALGLLIPWSWNEYRMGKPFTPVSPRSWWRGVSNGLGWDDNDFDVNYFRHPYHGQFYFNAARANGYGFGASVLHTVVGSYLWECCTETHVPSLPDMITTVVGGAALGESLYRVSSAVLDEQTWGAERIVREAAAALLDPARGITRLATGRSWSRTPESARARGDWPPGGRSGSPRLRIEGGARFQPGTEARRARFLPLLNVDWTDGDTFSRGTDLFSYHTLQVALYPGDRALLGAFAVRGALWRTSLDREGGGSGDGRGHGDVPGSVDVARPTGRFSLYLDVDYVDTEAYRFATHAVTGGWGWNRPVGARTRVGVEVEASLVPIGSVDSDYARLAEIRGVREREREYDFGAGAGARLGISLKHGGEPVARASYRFVALGTLNGSNVAGSHSSHLVHILDASFRYALADGIGLGAEGTLFLQDSRYGADGFVDAFRRHPEARLFVTWRPGGQ